MENKLDNLFRDQLSKHEKTPSDQAWEQIYDQLAAKKKKLWIKRFSIAASILLIATAGFVGYQSINNLNIENDGELVNSSSSEKNFESKKDIEPNEQLVVFDDQEEEQVIESAEEIQLNEKTAHSKLVEETESPTQFERESPIQKAEKSEMDVESAEPLLAEITEPDTRTEVYEEKASIDHEIENQELSLAVDEVNRDSSPERIAETQMTSEQNPKEELKTYPKVRIVYKANQDSELVASGKRPIINKGINKITEFSDEHLLTAERKTKLRNTKEDLLALNFSKILNKSSKDVEN